MKKYPRYKSFLKIDYSNYIEKGWMIWKGMNTELKDNPSRLKYYSHQHKCLLKIKSIVYREKAKKDTLGYP
jgi:hypothetical protein